MMCLKVVLILFPSLIFVSSEGIQEKLLGNKGIRITRLDGLCGGKNVSILNYFHGVTANAIEAHVANSTVIVKEDNASDGLKCSGIITRCQSRENLDSCEEFLKKNNQDFCQLINPDNIILNPFMAPYKPKYKCPLKKGLYQALNFTFNLLSFQVLPVDGWYWKIEVQCFLPKVNRLMGCGYLEGYTVMRSKH